MFSVTTFSPGLRKQIAAFEKQAKDESTKSKEAEKSASDAMEAYKKECQAIGIPGNSLDMEILDLVKEVPKLFQTAVQRLTAPSIATFVRFYREYCTYLNGNESENPHLTYLAYVQEHGDSIVEIVKQRLAQQPITSEQAKREEKK